MAKEVELSIIIVNFNTYSFLKSCLDSILKGDLEGSKYEIIVADNSSDNKKFKLLQQQYPKIRLIANRKNAGFARANNQAIKAVKGEYLLLLNPDTIVAQNTLKVMLAFMRTDTKVGIATCRVELPNGELDDACHRGFPTPWRALSYFSGLSSIFPTSLFFNGYHLGYQHMGRTHEIESCVGAFMMIRREVISQIGGLDEDYFWYGEDLDFCFRAKRRGWQVMYVPDASIIHYKGTSSGIKKYSQQISSANRKIQILATKSRFAVMRIFYNKHYRKIYPKWLTWLVLTGIKIKEQFALLKLRN